MSIMICEQCNKRVDTDYHEMVGDLCEDCSDYAEEWGDVVPDRV